MEIKSIRTPEQVTFDVKENQNIKSNSNVSHKTKPSTSIEDLSDWQLGVLQIATKYLDNMSQLENNHPLGGKNYKTIETLEEALSEVEKTSKLKFKEEGILAQANLSPQQVLHLFT